MRTMLLTFLAVALSLVTTSTQVQSVAAFAPMPIDQSISTARSTSITRLGLFDFLKQDDKEKPQSQKKSNDDDGDDDSTQQFSSDDPVEKIFSFFFGEKEESPMGMKRFGRGK